MAMWHKSGMSSLYDTPTKELLVRQEVVDRRRGIVRYVQLLTDEDLGEIPPTIR